MRFHHNISERNMPRGVFSSSLPRTLKKYAAITWSLKVFWQMCVINVDFPVPGLPLTQSTPLWLGRSFRSCHCWNCAVLNSQSLVSSNRFDVVPTSINAREAKRTQAILFDSLFIEMRIGQVGLSLGPGSRNGQRQIRNGFRAPKCLPMLMMPLELIVPSRRGPPLLLEWASKWLTW
jgi:hypothetical protein